MINAARWKVALIENLSMKSVTNSPSLFLRKWQFVVERVRNDLLVFSSLWKFRLKLSTKFSLVFCFLLFLFFFYSFAANNEPSNESSLSEIKWGLYSFRQRLLHGAVNKFVLEANIINRRKCNSVQRFSIEFSTSIREKEYRSYFIFRRDGIGRTMDTDQKSRAFR